ncbi:LEM-3-like GIY-YIG domain-containing protein [Hippea sp. KM1]|uniref:LEM-3-like GIY-YIG domain-containing protein n=1 Tax=Hippea sp. KM1 TaxID=944481 RepID=UPI00046C97C0|nr:excinuclease ABC [Hippea sp. KM1]
MIKFSERTIEKIGYYVYVLVDPRSDKIFYIGKGKGNRIFAHVNGALENETESDKIALIKEIINEGMEVQHYIVRHGIETEEIAFEIEATLIDLLTCEKFKHLSQITNIIAGHKSWERGIKTVDELEALYSAEPLNEIKHNLLLININKTYKKEKSIYEATRKSWRLSKKKVQLIDYVLAEYKGIVRAVFKPEKWLETEDGKRLYFKGYEVKDKKVLDLYLNKEYTGKKKGQQNPITYLWKKD